MLTVNRPISLILTLLLLLGGACKISAQGTAFNYQGRLSDSGSPANGSYDLRFAVYNAVTNGSQASISLTNFSVAVSNGLFSTTLDFGNLFTGSNYWLDVAVRATNVTTVFTTLVPRQPILPVPYAIFANTSSNLLGNLPATQLTGTVPSAQISGTYSGAVNFANVGNTFSGTFTGNGAALTSLNGSQITSGTVADARLTPNVALLSANQTFSGGNNFTNIDNNFSGNFFGNGLVGWIPTNAAIIQAVRDTGYLLTNSMLTTVVLPVEPNVFVKDIVRISGAGSGGWRTAQATNQSIIGNFSSYKNSLWILASFVATGNTTWRCFAASSDGTRMYAGASDNGIFSSTDAGHKWGQTTATGSGWLGLACSADGTQVFGAPASSDLQISTDAGLTWTAAGAGSKNWSAIACSADGSKRLASVNGGRLWTYTNSITGWKAVGPNSSLNWNSVAMSSDGTCMVASVSPGVIYVSTDTGVNWTPGTTNANWTAVAVSSDGSKYVATSMGKPVYTSTNFGVNWSLTTSLSTNWSCLAVSSDCKQIVAGVSNSVIYASVNFGGSWSALAGSGNQQWSALTSSSDGQVLAGAALGGNLYYSAGASQSATLTGTNGFISGSQGSAVELQYIGGGKFMPVSSSGSIWAN